MNNNNIIEMFKLIEKYLQNSKYIENEKDYSHIKNLLSSNMEMSFQDQQTVYYIIQDGRFYFNSRIDRVRLEVNNSEVSKIKMGYGLFFLDDFEKFNKCYLDYICSDYSSNFAEPNNRFKRSGPLPDWAYYERPIQNSDEAREILKKMLQEMDKFV